MQLLSRVAERYVPLHRCIDSAKMVFQGHILPYVRRRTRQVVCKVVKRPSLHKVSGDRYVLSWHGEGSRRGGGITECARWRSPVSKPVASGGVGYCFYVDYFVCCVR